MKKNSELIVDGFLFENEDLMKEAKKEAEGVRYMKARVDLQYPDRVLQIYQRMITQEMFQTQIGYAYLRELQDYLYTMPQIANDDVPPIPVHMTVRVSDASGTAEVLREENSRSRKTWGWIWPRDGSWWTRCWGGSWTVAVGRCPSIFSMCWRDICPVGGNGCARC